MKINMDVSYRKGRIYYSDSCSFSCSPLKLLYWFLVVLVFSALIYVSSAISNEEKFQICTTLNKSVEQCVQFWANETSVINQTINNSYYFSNNTIVVNNTQNHTLFVNQTLNQTFYENVSNFTQIVYINQTINSSADSERQAERDHEYRMRQLELGANQSSSTATSTSSEVDQLKAEIARLKSDEDVPIVLKGTQNDLQVPWYKQKITWAIVAILGLFAWKQGWFSKFAPQTQPERHRRREPEEFDESRVPKDKDDYG